MKMVKTLTIEDKKLIKKDLEEVLDRLLNITSGRIYDPDWLTPTISPGHGDSGISTSRYYNALAIGLQELFSGGGISRYSQENLERSRAPEYVTRYFTPN